MKIVLSTLNAKYIHTSLALRWLYVANKDRFDIHFREYTIKEDIQKIADELLLANCDILGLSVYIWNVTQIQTLISLLKQKKPELIIIAGGPEVTYEPEHFLNSWQIDYVISGEGEFVLGELLSAIIENKNINIPGVSSRNSISKTVVKADLSKLAQLPTPYQLEQDKDDLKNRLVYFETSRGCPYQCQYCLSSLEKGIRYFPENYIRENLEYLIQNGARQIKFLDRTFNLNKEHTLMVFDFLIENYHDALTCQFEIYADLLSDEMIDYLNACLPPDYFRFEIGIQSTYEPTNQAVKRKQDFPLLAHNIKRLMDGGKITLHLDLIAGLPYETFGRFAQSFNDVFTLKAKEIQLGFLKMLRGTNLRNNADKYGYVYSPESPYEIRNNTDISSEELHRIHEAEHTLEKYWNSGRFPLTMNAIFETYYKNRYFEFFDEFGQYYNTNKFKPRGYQLEDLFRYLDSFLQCKGIHLDNSLRKDYYGNFSQRPQGYWKTTVDKKMKKKLLYTIGQDKDFLYKHHLTRKIIEKQTAINPVSENGFLLTVFTKDEQNNTVRTEIIYTLRPAD